MKTMSIMLLFPVFWMLLSITYASVLNVNVCQPQCRLELVETIPIGVQYPSDAPRHANTADVWTSLITNAKASLDVASLYWTLQASDVTPDPSSSAGESVFRALNASAPLLRIAMNAVEGVDPDTEVLAKSGAQIKQVNMTALVGAGVLHTKFIIADKAHFYVGSANMDWRSLAQVKELGIVGRDCPCFAEDLSKVFSVYWALGGKSLVPDIWPKELATDINMETPAPIVSQGVPYTAFFSSSPNSFSPHGRTGDLEAVLHTIRRARSYVHIAVMDYFPLYIYAPHIKFWPYIDDELRRAYVSRGVNVKLLVSKWPHTRNTMLPFLRSLMAVNGIHSHSTIQVKWFIVPSNETFDHIPFARVNHNKYMVTDKTALIGTSNWSADYFTNTAGVSLVVSPSSNASSSIQTQLSQVFSRDWSSEYTTPISV